MTVTESVPKSAPPAKPPTAPESPDTLMTYTELAAVTGLKLGTLYAMVNRGDIPHLRLGRRLVRFRKYEIKAWLDERSVPAAKEVA